MGMGKGGQDVSKVRIPPELKEASISNLADAQRMAQLPFAPNRGLQVAAFTPMQMNAMRGVNSAAGAFGLPSSGGMNLPRPTNVGGFQGYGTGSLLDNAMGQLPPAIRELYDNFFKTKTIAGPTGGKKISKRETPRVSNFRPDSGGAGKGGVL